MKRREFIATLTGAAAWPLVARAQKRNPTVGMLSNTGDVAAGFQQGLADFGYVVGQNISLIRKNIEGNLDRLDQLLAELVAINPDVIFGGGSQTTIALERQTSTDGGRRVLDEVLGRRRRDQRDADDGVHSS
jgi:putative tryptophan/tyrosine transport system substrate-binding protein